MDCNICINVCTNITTNVRNEYIIIFVLDNAYTFGNFIQIKFAIDRVIFSFVFIFALHLYLLNNERSMTSMNFRKFQLPFLFFSLQSNCTILQ